MTKSAGKPHVFHTLDILRGVAAVAVMAFHFGLSGSGLLGVSVFPHGYLAVDFFFVLSGFVLAFAYQDKLDLGWSSSSFFLVRVIRLYPLYFAGLVLGFAFSVLQSVFGRHQVSATTTFLTLVASLLMVPAFGLKQQTGEATIYPYNKPAWSLFFEIMANVFHALLLRRRSWKFLAGTLCVTGAALIYSCLRYGSIGFGVNRSEFLYGFARVLFSYTVGISLLRVWKSGRGRMRVPPLVIAILLLIALAVPVYPRFTALYDLAATFILFPILVLAGAWSQPGPWFMRSCEWLGTASYAIYVLHVPIADFFAEAVRRISHREPALFAPWTGIACILLSIAAALLLDKFYDGRARTFLRKKLLRGNGAPARPTPNVKVIS